MSERIRPANEKKPIKNMLEGIVHLSSVRTGTAICFPSLQQTSPPRDPRPSAAHIPTAVSRIAFKNYWNLNDHRMTATAMSICSASESTTRKLLCLYFNLIHSTPHDAHATISGHPCPSLHALIKQHKLHEYHTINSSRFLNNLKFGLEAGYRIEFEA